jgi:hypothetical protein
VGYNGRGFFSVCGIQRKRFFPLWDTTEEVFSAVGYNGEKLYNTLCVISAIKYITIYNKSQIYFAMDSTVDLV